MGATKKAGKAPTAKAHGRAAKLKATHKDTQTRRVVSEVPRDLAEKKKHVRELAKAGDWEQIKRLYGEKMVKKAKAYVEKNGTSAAEAEVPVARQLPPPPSIEKMTPQLIAKQLLAMNGYTTKDDAVENPPQAPVVQHLVTPKPPREVPVSAKPMRSPSHSTARQVRQQGSFRSPTTPARAALIGTRETPIAIVDSPETLTEEQKRQIEERRRQALQKRKRVIEPTIPTVTPRGCHVIPGSVEHRHVGPTVQRSSVEVRGVRERQPVHVLPPAPPVVYSTPAKTPQNVEHASIEQVMQDELDVAAQITDWDFEPIDCAHPRVVTPPTRPAVQNCECPTGHHDKLPPRKDPTPQSSARHRTDYNPPINAPVHNSTVVGQGRYRSRVIPVVSLSQELAAAAEIARWEEEQERRSEPSKPSEAHQADTAKQRLMTKRQSAGNERKPTSGTAPQPQPIQLLQPERTAISNEEKETKRVESFIAKHFLEDKLDAAVLDFVNMMLA